MNPTLLKPRTTHHYVGDSPAGTGDLQTDTPIEPADATPSIATPEAAAQSETAPSEPPSPPKEVDAALAETLLKAVEESRERAEKSVLQAMAEQNGHTEEELAALLAQARAEQEETAPLEEIPAPTDITARLQQRLLLAEVKGIGAEMGLIDPEVALGLIDPITVTVDEQGAVTGVRAALEHLRQSKAYLFRVNGRGAWAQRVGSGGMPMSGVEEAFYRKNPGLRK